jgi:GAF domain
MKSRAARLALLVLFVTALGVTAYLFRKSETARRAETTAGDSFNSKARAAARGILELRAAQQAYVATGQGEDFWAIRVASTLGSIRDDLTALRASAASPEAQSSIDAAAGSLQDFSQMDARAREYVRTGQKLLASDMIFSNGGELTEAALTSLDKATAAEQLARAASTEIFARRQNFALVAAAAAAGLVMLLLLPRVEHEIPAPSFLEPTVPVPASVRKVAPQQAGQEEWSEPRRVSDTPVPSVASPAAVNASLSAESPVAHASPVAEPASAPAPAPVPAFDFKAVATLCTELSRVDDTMALPPLLERAATVLDAAGIILWIADPDGRELNPVLAQGYPPHLVNRLGTIPRGAENATAAAFRTGMMQTVYADGTSNGAIAAPLVTCGGCVGVMAAEVRGDTERLEANLAAATILAAQLASLVGPPAVRSSDAKVEAANA